MPKKIYLSQLEDYYSLDEIKEAVSNTASITKEEVEQMIKVAVEKMKEDLDKKQDKINWEGITIAAPFVITGGNEPTNLKPLEVTVDGNLLSYGKEVNVKE